MSFSNRKPMVVVLRTAGTNCDKETAFAFKLTGARVELLHINQFINGSRVISDFEILAIPGGFSYGDDIAAGKILANELKYRLGEDLISFLESGKLAIGICNGFQVLVKAGILPGVSEKKQILEQQATLASNDSNKFEARWVHLKAQRSNCIWTKGLPDLISLPVAHAEGKFVVSEKATLDKIKKNRQIVLRYCKKNGRPSTDYPDNPNGSVDNIAGICDISGRVFGLMPHPERHIWNLQSPDSSLESSSGAKFGDGLQIFENGVRYARMHS